MSQQPVSRDQTIDTAKTLINGQRASDYGDAKENFARIADLWKPVFGHEITGAQVAMALAQLKIARLITSPTHADSWVDLVGYAALGSEVATHEAAKDSGLRVVAQEESEAA